MALLPVTSIVFLLLLFATGCGDEGGGSDPPSRSAPPASEFPAPGASLDDVLAEGASTDEIVVSPAGAVYTPGDNRFGFGVFTVAREQITDAEVAIYAAPGPDGKPRGPFPARIETLETDPAFRSRTTAEDPDAALALYVTEIPLDRPGEWRLVALVRDDDRLLASRLHSIEVAQHPEIPAVGEAAPRVHTPTVEDVGDVSQIDTRVPHDTMHEEDLADVLGEKPVVLVFATPALCQSRVCGPVVDVAEQVKAETDNDVAFIHMEVYEDNNASKGLRPQLRAFGLPTEPWLFAMDSTGNVATRIEGGFGVEDVRQAVDTVSGSPAG
ncbi:MAG: hypothetical protein AABM42_12650 [Actinomycetota bacterium]